MRCVGAGTDDQRLPTTAFQDARSPDHQFEKTGSLDTELLKLAARFRKEGPQMLQFPHRR